MTRAQIARERKALEAAYKALFANRARRAAQTIPVTLRADDAVTDLELLRALDSGAEIKAALATVSPKEQALLKKLIIEAAKIACAEQALYAPTILSADPKTWSPGVIEQIAAAARAELAAQEALLTQTTAAQIQAYADKLAALRRQEIDRAQVAAALRERTRVALSYAEQEAIRAANATQATFTEARNVSAGITSYIWVANNDEITRPLHRQYNGQTFLWAQPPPDGHPGHPYGCRCSAKPVLRNVPPAQAFPTPTFTARRADLAGIAFG